jgi:hypothetical protein
MPLVAVVAPLLAHASIARIAIAINAAAAAAAAAMHAGAHSGQKSWIDCGTAAAAKTGWNQSVRRRNASE